MTRVWARPLLLVCSGAAAAVVMGLGGDAGSAVVVFLVFGALAAMNSPLVFPRSVGAVEARRRSAVDGRPVVYWRPGCVYCLRLRLRLGRGARRAYWVDIWRDPEGAAAVREANGGDETVPTVLVAGRSQVNPDPGWVRAQLDRAG